MKSLISFSLFILFGCFSTEAKSISNVELKELSLAPAIPSNLTVSNVCSTSASVSWDPIPNATYIVRYKPPGVANWTILQVSNPFFSLDGLAPCTLYELNVAAVDNSGTSSFNTSVLINTLQTACSAMSSNGNDVYISSVNIIPNGSISMTNNSANSNYTNFSCDETRQIKLLIGSTGNTITVTKSWMGTTSNAQVQAWIDFNWNTTFEASEQILNSTLDASNSATSTFNVPASLLGSCGGVMMRVIVSNVSSTAACGSFSVGEVEDYGVKFINEPILAIQENLKMEEPVIFPNPVNDFLNISKGNDKKNYQIYNSVGQLVMKGQIEENRIDVQKLSKGVYFISILGLEKENRLKFIKK